MTGKIGRGIARGAAALLLASSLSGCVAGMAVSAVSAVARSARQKPVDNAQLMPQAVAVCSAEAARYGTVTVIDRQQISRSRITVWGTVDKDGARQSFECGFGTKMVKFKLRPIVAAP